MKIKVDDEVAYNRKQALSENDIVEDKEVNTEEVCGKEKLRKTILRITCIPYVLIFLLAFYSYFVGSGWMDAYYRGWDAVMNTLELIGLFLVFSPLGFLMLLCVIYQIIYFIDWKKKQKD